MSIILKPVGFIYSMDGICVLLLATQSVDGWGPPEMVVSWTSKFLDYVILHEK